MQHKLRNVEVKKIRMTTVVMLTGLRFIISDKLRFSGDNVNLCIYATPFRAMNCKPHTVNVGVFFFFLQWPVNWLKMLGNEQSAAKPFGYNTNERMMDHPSNHPSIFFRSCKVRSQRQLA